MELQTQVEKVVGQIDGFKRRVEEMEEKNKDVEQERESWRKELEQLQKRVAKLEGILAFRKCKWEKQRERAMLNIKKKKDECKKISLDINATLKLFEKERKIAEEAKERTMKIQDLLRKNVQQVANLTSALKKQKQENEKTRQIMERRNTFHLHTIIKLQNTLKCRKEEKELVELQKHNLMIKQEQLEKCVVQLEAILVSEQETQKQYKQLTNLNIKDENMNQK